MAITWAGLGNGVLGTTQSLGSGFVVPGSSSYSDQVQLNVKFHAKLPSWFKDYLLQAVWEISNIKSSRLIIRVLHVTKLLTALAGLSTKDQHCFVASERRCLRCADFANYPNLPSPRGT